MMNFPTRRELLQSASAGFGYLAFSGLSTLHAQETAAAANPLAPKAPHFKARAKRVIFLCMQGGPSHVDTFDYKPKLASDAGKGGKSGGGKLLASPWKFKQQGKSGLWISQEPRSLYDLRSGHGPFTDWVPRMRACPVLSH